MISPFVNHIVYERDVPSMSKDKKLKNGKIYDKCVFETSRSPLWEPNK